MYAQESVTFQLTGYLPMKCIILLELETWKPVSRTGSKTGAAQK
jgi:hypothetical protein